MMPGNDCGAAFCFAFLREYAECKHEDIIDPVFHCLRCHEHTGTGPRACNYGIIT